MSIQHAVPAQDNQSIDHLFSAVGANPHRTGKAPNHIE